MDDITNQSTSFTHLTLFKILTQATCAMILSDVFPYTKFINSSIPISVFLF